MAMRALILAAIAAVTTAAKVHPERLTQVRHRPRRPLSQCLLTQKLQQKPRSNEIK